MRTGSEGEDRTFLEDGPLAHGPRPGNLAVFLHPEARRLGRIRGVTFSRIRAEAEAGVVIWGSPESVIDDVLLDDVRMRVVRGPHSDAYGGYVDLRGARDMARSLFARDLPALLAERVGRLTLRGFEVEWGEDVPAFSTHAVECVDFHEVEIDRFRGWQAQETGSALCLVRGKDVVVRNSRATSGTNVFLETRDLTEPPVVTGGVRS